MIHRSVEKKIWARFKGGPVNGRCGVLCCFSLCTIWHRLGNRRQKSEGIFDVPSSQRIVPLSEERTVIPGNCEELLAFCKVGVCLTCHNKKGNAEL